MYHHLKYSPNARLEEMGNFQGLAAFDRLTDPFGVPNAPAKALGVWTPA